MKDNRIFNLLLHFLQLFMQLCVAVTVTNFVLHGFMAYEEFQTFNTLYIGAVVTAYYFVKSFVSNSKLAVIFHVAVLISVLFAVNGAAEDKLLVFVPAAVLMYYSLHKSSEKPVFALDMAVMLACYLLGFTISAKSAQIVPFYGILMYVTAYMIWYNITNLNKLLAENVSVKSFNPEQSVNVNSVMIAVFVTLCIFLMIVIPYLRLESVMWGILDILWKLVLKFCSLFKIEISQESVSIEQTISSYTSSSSESPLLGIAAEDTNATLILNVIAAVFAAVIVVFMVIMLFKAIKGFRYHQSNKMDVKEFILPEISKDKTVRSRKRKIFEISGGGNERARKIYYRLIRSKTPKTQMINPAYTPFEITEEKLGINTDSKTLTKIYEQARYGDTEIDKKLVEEMKKKAEILQ